MPEVLDLLAEAVSAVARVAAARAALTELGDEELLEAQRRLAALDRHTSATAATTAAEIAWRSRPVLGDAGLAQRTGARTPESLVQQLTGSTGRDAATLVRVGKVMAEAELLPPTPEPASGESQAAATDETPTPWDGTGTAWLAPAGRAVAAGTLPVTAADAIRAGLGTPTDTITVAQLATATARLVDEAAHLNADQLFRRARAVRDEIDADGIVERERQRHAQRYVKVFARQDGMIRIDGLLAPESGGAEVLATVEAVTSPRRGGPRFVDPDEIERAKRLKDDDRTDDQLRADALVELLRLGADADPGRIVGSKKPAVRVLVPADHLNTAHETSDGTGNATGANGGGTGKVTGFGRIEGHPDPVSIATVQRNICETGILPILFDDDGQCLNLGRTQRLFTQAQRVALAARDGGCRFPDCDRPPSWCEAHHITRHTDGGRTDVADGILLCRHHHMLLHNNHWRIRRHGGRYLLIPPRERDPNQEPIELPSKSAALADLYRRKRAG